MEFLPQPLSLLFPHPLFPELDRYGVLSGPRRPWGLETVMPGPPQSHLIISGRWYPHPTVLLVAVMILPTVANWVGPVNLNNVRLACSVSTFIPSFSKYVWLGFYRVWQLDISSHLHDVSMGNTYVRKNYVVTYLT